MVIFPRTLFKSTLVNSQQNLYPSADCRTSASCASMVRVECIKIVFMLCPWCLFCITGRHQASVRVQNRFGKACGTRRKIYRRIFIVNLIGSVGTIGSASPQGRFSSEKSSSLRYNLIINCFHPADKFRAKIKAMVSDNSKQIYSQPSSGSLTVPPQHRFLIYQNK